MASEGHERKLWPRHDSASRLTVQPLEEAEAQLKAARAAKRKLKRQKRRERARAAAATRNKEGTLDAPQAEAVGDAEQAVSGAGGESTPRRMTAPTFERGHTGLKRPWQASVP